MNLCNTVAVCCWEREADDTVASCLSCLQDPLKISHIIAVDGVGTGSATDIYIHSPTADETFGDQVGAEGFFVHTWAPTQLLSFEFTMPCMSGIGSRKR